MESGGGEEEEALTAALILLPDTRGTTAKHHGRTGTYSSQAQQSWPLQRRGAGADAVAVGDARGPLVGHCCPISIPERR